MCELLGNICVRACAGCPFAGPLSVNCNDQSPFIHSDQFVTLCRYSLLLHCAVTTSRYLCCFAAPNGNASAAPASGAAGINHQQTQVQESAAHHQPSHLRAPQSIPLKGCMCFFIPSFFFHVPPPAPCILQAPESRLRNPQGPPRAPEDRRAFVQPRDGTSGTLSTGRRPRRRPGAKAECVGGKREGTAVMFITIHSIDYPGVPQCEKPTPRIPLDPCLASLPYSLTPQAHIAAGGATDQTTLTRIAAAAASQATEAAKTATVSLLEVDLVRSGG